MKSKLILLLSLFSLPLPAGEHISLFNGTDLGGWHTQSDGEWSVTEGAIRGVNPNGNWCHLITDESFTDFYISLRYKIIRGNSGLYVRAINENGGCCGLEGLQVDFGPSQDGSVMPVVDGRWWWYEKITRAVDEGIVDYTQWNRLDVEVQGSSITTFVNGEMIYNNENAEEMPPSGTFGLQLHSGGAGDTILFKDIELYLPGLMPGCMDSSYLEYDTSANLNVEDSCKTEKIAYCPDTNYVEYNPEGNFPDSALCETLGAAWPADFQKKSPWPLILHSGDDVSLPLPAGASGLALYNTRGQRIWMYSYQGNAKRKRVNLPLNTEKGLLFIRYFVLRESRHHEYYF